MIGGSPLLPITEIVFYRCGRNRGVTMEIAAEDEPKRAPTWWARRNWWKVGFFTMLVLFECAREIAVLESDASPRVATSAYVGSIQGYTSAKGRWVRIDGGSQLVPGATSITCYRDKGFCIEATATMFDGYVNEPSVDTIRATFSPDAVTYENDNPQCARYNVRIDLNLKKVFAVRHRKPNPPSGLCQNMERRIEMTLGDGYQEADSHIGEHFLPIIQAVAWLS